MCLCVLWGNEKEGERELYIIRERLDTQVIYVLPSSIGYEKVRIWGMNFTSLAVLNRYKTLVNIFTATYIHISSMFYTVLYLN